MSHKCADYNWKVTDDGGVHSISVEHSQLAVLMDIRRELKEANGHLRVLSSRMNCPQFLSIPRVLKRISRNTAKKRKKVRKAP